MKQNNLSKSCWRRNAAYSGLLIAFFALINTATAFSQKEIKGTVTSDSVNVLAGVKVEIKGTTVSTLTDQNGNYAIVVGDDAVLVFRYEGYTPLEIPVHGRIIIDVVMQRSKLPINEPVKIYKPYFNRPASFNSPFFSK